MPLVLNHLAKAVLCAAFVLAFLSPAFAQGTGTGTAGKTVKTNQEKGSAALPKVTQVDIAGLKALLKPNGKPLLINFWATWCPPCREEFPDLVKLDTVYRGKVDFITVSLDDLADIKTYVPKFLAEMKAEMPAYLLKTPDESAAIALVSSDWNGNLPLTVLYTAAGGSAYLRKGKIRYETMTAEIDKVLAAVAVQTEQMVELSKNPAAPDSFEKGVAEAKRDIALGKYKIVRYGLTPAIPRNHLDRLLQNYSITVSEAGCSISTGYPDYARGYNETTIAALKHRFGNDVLADVQFAQNP